MTLKDAAEETLKHTGKRMADEKPFVAFLLFIIILLLIWYLYSNHALQQQIIEMRLMDYKAEIDRFDRIDSFERKLDEVSTQINDLLDAETKYMNLLRAIRDRACSTHKQRDG